MFRWSPAWLAYGVAGALTPILVWITERRERRIGPLGRGMIRNQRIAVRGGWKSCESRAHLRAWAQHMTSAVVDFCRMPRIDAANLERHVDVSDVEQIRALHAEGNGVICASGHLGIWEMGGHITSLLGLPTLSVSRPSSNPALHRRLLRMRESGGQRIVQKWGVLWPLQKALSRGEMIGIAADENVTQDPVFAPFLGTLAATSTTTAALARRSGAPIVVMSCHRVGRAKFKLHVWDVIRVQKSRDRSTDYGDVPARINRALTRAIAQYPEQWIWGSRRFATRPDGESLDADGLPPRCEAAEHVEFKLGAGA